MHEANHGRGRIRVNTELGESMNTGKIVIYIQEIISNVRIQNYHGASLRFRELIVLLEKDVDLRGALAEEDNSYRYIMQQILSALESEDMILFADILEEVFLPYIKEMICADENIITENYCLESTASGYLTVKHLRTDKYLHTNVNPLEEARLLVEECYNPKFDKYVVWGCGLGYHILRLFEISKGSIDICVFDEDADILRFAREYGVLSDIPAERIQVVHDPEGKKFAQSMRDERVGLLLHLPSIRKIENSNLQNALHQLFASWNGAIVMKRELAINFRCNQKHCSKNVDELAPVFHGSNVIIVGAGPSLNDLLPYLKKEQGKKKIVAVTTIWKKLLDAGIFPDYVFVMDPQQRTIGHLTGVENTQVPLLLDSTAYWEFADKYAGEKYIIYQRGYTEAEQCAEKGGYKTYETGGTVVTLAMDVVLAWGARAIYMVGIDLAYPKGVSHAVGTMDYSIRDVSDMEMVEDVKGGLVYQDRLFAGYRKWIERKIEEYPQVAFYNLSTCGAKIRGANSLIE